MIHTDEFEIHPCFFMAIFFEQTAVRSKPDQIIRVAFQILD